MSDQDLNSGRTANCRAAISWFVAGVTLTGLLPLLVTVALYIVHDCAGAALQHSMLGVLRRYAIVASGWFSVSFVVSAWYLARSVARPAGRALIAVTVAYFLLTVSGGLLGPRYAMVQMLGSLVGLLALIFGLLILRANWRIGDPMK